MSKTTKKIEFIEETHTYLVDGIIVPSVTTILDDGGLKFVNPHLLEMASIKGSNVHYASEMIDKGEKPLLDSSYAEYVVQYLLYKNEHNHQWDTIEEMLYTDEFAGTADRIGKLNGKILIADVKTTSVFYKKKVSQQIAGYIIAHADMNGNKLDDYVGGAIWLAKDRWRYVDITPDFDGFLAKLEEWKARNKTDEISW